MFKKTHKVTNNLTLMSIEIKSINQIDIFICLKT